MKNYHNMGKVDSEVAEKDFDRFIEELGVNELKLKKLEEEKNAVIELIEFGYLSINDDGVPVYKLQKPISFGNSENVAHDTVTFKMRKVTVGDMEKYMTGKTDIEKSRKIMGFVTGLNSGILKNLEDDFMNISNIGAFFLPR